jgi:threonine dehydrogenase-like Zn-dependent dehydrogenase
MRVARVMAPRVIRGAEAPVPAIQAGYALVRVTAEGICRADL